MTVTVEPRNGVGTYEERWGDSPQIRQQYVLFSDDPLDDFVVDVKAAFWDPINVPIMRHGLYRGDPVLQNTPANVGDRRAWYGDWSWSLKRAPNKDNPVRVSGSTRGGRATIKKALETTGRWVPSGLQAREHGGAIEHDLKTGEIKGCEVPAPAFSKRYEIYIETAVWSKKFEQFLYRSTPSVNSAKWDVYEPGEGVFLGCDWDYTLGVLNDGGQEDLVKATFYFEGAGNEVLSYAGIVGNQTINNVANAGFVKLGHEHIWAEYEQVEDTATGATKHKLRQVNTERVLPWLDFKKLGFIP